MNDHIFSGSDEQAVYATRLNRDRLVHIVDTNLATCESLCVLFRLDGFQTIFSPEVGHFILSLERRRPDVVVLNLRMGEESGLGLLRRVKSMRNGTPVFMLADAPRVDEAVAAMKLGAVDVVSKPIDTEYLLTIVRDSLRRDVHLGAVQDGRRPVEVRGFSQLTSREREVLQLITNGKTNRETADDLGISSRTIEVHRGSIMKKLGAHNTADLMRIVLTS